MDTLSRARELALAGIEARAYAADAGGGGGTGGKTAHEPAGSPKGGQFTSRPGNSGGSRPSHRPTPKPKPKLAAPQSTPQAPATPRLVKEGDSGEDVRYAQYAMSLLGFKVAQDGRFGPETTAAVKQMQQRLGMKHPNGHITPALLHKMQDAVRLSPCVGGGGQRGLSLDDGFSAKSVWTAVNAEPWEQRDDGLEDGDLDFDETAEAILDALDEFERSTDWAERARDVSKELRVPGGHEGGGRWTKNPITSAIAKALEDWRKGDGPDDPFVFDGKPIDREPLRKAAVARGITLKRGASRDEIVEALKADVRVKVGEAKAAKSPEAGKPVKFTLTGGADQAGVRLENDIRASYRRHLGETGWVSLADIRNDLGEKYNRHDVDVTLKRLATEPDSGVNIVPQSNQKALTQADRDAALHIGGQQRHFIHFDDASAKPIPSTKLRNLDVGVYTENGKVSLWEVSDSGQRRRRVAQADDLAGLEKWATDHGETEVADWARRERGTTAPDELDDIHTGALADLARENDISVPYPPRESDRPEILQKLRAAGITQLPEDVKPTGPTPEQKAAHEAFVMDTLRQGADGHGWTETSTMTGRAGERNRAIAELRRRGLIRREGGIYALTPAGRTALADWARKEQGAKAPDVPAKATKAATGDASARSWIADQERRRNDLRSLVAQGGKAERLPGGHNADVELVTTADGSRYVHKGKVGNRGPGVAEDAEELGALVAQAAGARSPAVIRAPDGTLYEEYVPGRTGYSFTGPDSLIVPKNILDSEQGRRQGLADAIMGLSDRSNPGNWLMTDGKELVGIDHGTAFLNSDAPTGNPFARYLVGTDGKFKPNGLSQSELAPVRDRMEHLRPEFERLGHLDWWQQSMDRLVEIERNAAATKAAKKAASKSDLAAQFADEPGLHPLAARGIRESKGNTQTLRAKADAYDSMAVAVAGNPALGNPALGLTPTGYREMARQLRSAADRIDAQSAPTRATRTFADRPNLTADQMQQRRVDAGFSSQPTEADVDTALDRLSRPELVELSDRLNLTQDARIRHAGGRLESIKSWSADKLKRHIREESLGQSRRTTGAIDDGAMAVVDTSLDIRPATAAITTSVAKSTDLAHLRTLDPETRRDQLDLVKVGTVDEPNTLKGMLKSQGLPVSGRKRELVDRLTEHLGGEAGPKPKATRGAERPSYIDAEGSLLLENYAASLGMDLRRYVDPQRSSMVTAGQPVETQYPFSYPLAVVIDGLKSGKVNQQAAVTQLRQVRRQVEAQLKHAQEAVKRGFPTNRDLAIIKDADLPDVAERLADAVETLKLPKRRRRPTLGALTHDEIPAFDETRFAVPGGGSRFGSRVSPKGGLILHRGEVVPESFQHPRSGFALMQDESAPVRPGLTEAENHALDLYVSSAVADPLNGALRLGEEPPTVNLTVLGEKAPVDLREVQRHLDEAIANSTVSRDTTLWRGALMRPHDIRALTPGAIVTEPAYMSTAADGTLARNIIAWRKKNAPAYQKPVLFRILTPKGTNAAVGHESAGEVLFGRGSRLQVIGSEEEKWSGTTIFTVLKLP